MEIIEKEIGELTAYENNSRTHSDEQINQIIASINEFGFTNPLLINPDNGVIAGHGRLRAAIEAGMDKVPCIILKGLTEAQERAYVIADNQLALNAGWNMDILALELADLKDMTFDIDLIGFDGDFLDDLLVDKKNEGLTDEDAVPDAPEKPITKSGDVWLMGDHRVMCGDSTNIDHVEMLMNGKIANMLFTSPPYNAGENVYDPTSKVTKGKYEAYDDDIDPNEWKSLVNDTLTVWRQFTEYQFMNIQQLAGNKKSFWQFASDNSDYLADVSVWNKGHTAPAYATNVMNSSFEFVLIFAQKENPSRAISTANFRGTVSNVLDMGGQRSNEFSHVHSATFPVAMTEHYITSFTSSNSIICDSFNGVGTTLIASEKNNRLYYGMEIDPLYVDCTVIRWQEYTGKYAVLESTGETYNRSVPRGTIVE